MKQWIWIIALCFTIPAMAGAHETGKQMAVNYENTPVNYAHEHWKQGNNSLIPFMFIDVRTAEEYAAGHIRGARLMPLKELAGHINEIPRYKAVYVYCSSGKRSSRAALLLTKYGFSNIINVVGGIAAWRKAGYPVQQK